MAKSTQRFVTEPVQPFSFDILPAETPLWTDIDGMNSSRQVKLWWQIAFRVETTAGGNVRYGSIAAGRLNAPSRPRRCEILDQNILAPGLFCEGW